MSTTFLASASQSVSASGTMTQTRIYINEVSEYELLSGCAELPVSTIVRGMVNGCGDGSRKTSYACFCHSSSSHFNSLIAQRVSTACSNDLTQVGLATSVFHKYCEIGATRGLPTAALPSTTVSPTKSTSDLQFDLVSSQYNSSLASAPTSAATSTPNISAHSSSQSKIIAVAVSVPVILIALAAGTIFLYRAKKKARRGVDSEGNVNAVTAQGADNKDTLDNPQIVEFDDSHTISELPEAEKIVELPGDYKHS